MLPQIQARDGPLNWRSRPCTFAHRIDIMAGWETFNYWRLFTVRSMLAALTLSFTCVLPAALAADNDTTETISILNSKQKRYGHLEHVGFYASAMRHWNFTEVLSGVTNITWIESSNIETLITRIEEAKNNSVKVVLSVQPLILDPDYVVRSDFLYRLSNLQQRIAAEGLLEHIAMIYPIDEPYLVASRSTATNRQGIYQDLLTINDDLNTLFPSIPLGVIFASQEILRKDFKIPPSYDWISYDCYKNMFDCDEKPATEYYGTLLKNMT